MELKEPLTKNPGEISEQIVWEINEGIPIEMSEEFPETM